jgi:hypothetical protein
MVTIHLQPDMHISGDTVLCVENTIHLIGNPTGGNWFSNNPAVATIDNNGYVKGIDGGIVTISYIYKHVTNCVYTLTHEIEVYPLPAGGDILTAQIDTICQGDTLFLQATAQAGYTPVWYSNASLTKKIGSGVKVPLLGVSAGTHTYYVVAQNTATGCIALNAMSQSVNGTVLPAPSLAVTTPHTMHGQGTFSLYSLVINPNPGLYDYSFAAGDPLTPTDTIQTLATGLHSFVAIATDKTTTCTSMQPIQIVVTSLTGTEFVSVIHPAAVCVEETTTAFITITNNDIVPQNKVVIATAV